LALLLAPVNAYQSVLTLLAIPQYVPLLTPQPFNTRRALAHAVVTSVLKNETLIETPEDVDGVLELCHVLIKDQPATSVPVLNGDAPTITEKRTSHSQSLPMMDDVAEEQGWVARMTHLFRSSDLETQYEVSLAM
jgi:vacuolar protein sorting-associated protein 35